MASVTMNRNFGRMAIVATLAVVAILLATGVGLSAVEKAEASGEQEAIEQLSVTKLTPEQLEKLTLEEYKDVSQVLLESSMSKYDKERTDSTGFSDALTFGFEAKDDAGKFAELQEEILRNPIYGVTVAKAIYEKRIGKYKIGTFNPWMGEMISLHTKYGTSYWCEYRGSDQSTIYVTDEYRIYAATLCTWLERLRNQGVHAWQTVENWPLNAAMANNDRIGYCEDRDYVEDAFGNRIPMQYTADALILTYVSKSQVLNDKVAAGTGLFVIGFNIHDKRPEFYGETPDAPTPDPPGPPTPPTPPTPPDPPNPPDNGGDKDPAEDPVNNGNANKGGGDNKPSDGSGKEQPVDPRTEKPTGSENDNNHGYSDPATVVPGTPPVDPSHQGKDIVDHENKMTYEPDPVTDRGAADGSAPTATDGDGEFVPND